MNQTDLRNLIRECLTEVLAEGQRICAWCKKNMGVSDIEGDSHGICPECREKMMGDIQRLNPEPADPRSNIRQPDSDMSHYMGDMDRT